MAYLKITEGRFSAEGKQLLGPINLAQECTGIVAVLGPNGAGKSLFLSLCHGTLNGASGQVLWNDTPAEQSRHTRGFMSQQVAVLRRSVFANVEFALQAQGVQRANRANRVRESLQQARLTDQALAPAATLSGGEQRRMALARALVGKPSLVLMDEPSAGLDPASSKELEEMVQRSVASGVNVLMVIHDIAQARRLANHVMFFSHGQLVENSSADSFFTNPKSDAAQAYLEGRLE